MQAFHRQSAAQAQEPDPIFEPGASGVGPLDTAPLRRPALLADTVTRWIEESETTFLEVGKRLQDVHGRISAVRCGIGRVTEILATPEMAAMRAGLSAAVECAASVGSLLDERRAGLAELRSAVDEAADGGAAVKLVFRTLDYIVLIARAQIGGMSSGQAELIPFASHVDELVSSGEDVARYIDQRMSQLHAILDETRSLESEERPSGASNDLTEGFGHLITLIEGQRLRDGASRDEAQEAFTGVWKAIGGVVMGLQAHDMARQRFEHTARSLGVLEALAETGRVEPDAEPVPAPLREAAARRILLLEIAQIEDLAIVYSERMGGLDSDLAAIAVELDICSAILNRLRPRQTGNEGLRMLEAQASRLRTGFRLGDERRQRLATNLQHSVEATSSLVDMTAKLDDLEHDLRLAGFNAAVRAAHVTGGDETIGYVAGVIREQASKARDEADRVRSGIVRANASTQRLSEEILPAVLHAERTIEAALDTASSLLTNADRECGGVLDAAITTAGGLAGEIATVRALMGSHEEGYQLMSCLSAALSALVSGMATASLPDEETERLDRFLVAPYTMEEERTVFQRTIGPLPDASAGGRADTAAPTTAVDDIDDILF